jgi:DNA-directed RNA polymerase specialized sigma24 family protein
MVNHEYLINRALNRNIALIKALRLEPEDVYQDLMISMLNAIEEYDSMRSHSIAAHLYAKIQYAILDMKRRHKPCGITGTGNNRVSLVSIEYYYEDGGAYDIPVEDDTGSIDFSDILDVLSLSEREALDMRMAGYTLRKKRQRDDFSIACEKMLAML